VDVVADNVQFLGRADGSGDGSGAQGGQRSQSGDNVDFNEQDFDDIPF